MAQHASLGSGTLCLGVRKNCASQSIWDGHLNDGYVASEAAKCCGRNPPVQDLHAIGADPPLEPKVSLFEKILADP